ncbi:MAG: hypothetical protein ACRDSH_21860 [Pseudonocardiaceae bacterium]
MMVAALIVSILAVVVSVAATRYARRSAQASEKSAVAASTTAALELDRRHADRTPRLQIRCQPTNPGSDQLHLTVFLMGPPELSQLDGLTVTIRDDHPWRRHGTPVAGGPTPEQVSAHIWGPYRFVPGTGPGADPSHGVPGADSTGRSTPTAGLPVGEKLPFFLEPSPPPSWSDQTPQDWRRERGTVVRLTFECHQSGSEHPWTLTGEIDTQTDNPIEVPAADS